MHFGTLNYTVLGIYLAVILLIGAWFARRQKTTEDYFLAGRNMPWWPVAMSMYASVTSAITFMGLPAMAYSGDISLLVVCVVSPLLAPVLILVIYPFYREMHVTTSYEYILGRFGPGARYTVSALFILARLGWLGTVIYAPALALHVATGIPLKQGILLMGGIATLYTMLGGLASVLWTDVVQFVVLIAGAVWLAVSLVNGVPGGIGEILEVSRAGDRLANLTGLKMNLFEMTGLMAAISFFFSMMQEYGTDQVTAQRLLAVRSRRGMNVAIAFNAAIDFLVVGLLLFIGLGLFAYAQTHPAAVPEGMAGDAVLPYYIMHALPAGISGLVITAIFAAAMSSLDSGINSIATVITHDFVQPLSRKLHREKTYVLLARILTLLLGVGATYIAFRVSEVGNIIKVYKKIMGLFASPILALFLLGMFSSRVRFRSWGIGALAGLALTIRMQFYLYEGQEIHWVYYFPAALAVTLVVSLLVSLLWRDNADQVAFTVWRKNRV